MALGTWYLGKKDINGWWLRMFGNLGWVVLGVQLGLTSIWMWELIFLGLGFKALCDWKKELQVEQRNLGKWFESEPLTPTLPAAYEDRPRSKFGLPYDPDSFAYQSWLAHGNRRCRMDMVCWAKQYGKDQT